MSNYFIPRLSKPQRKDSTYKYYTKDSYGGYNGAILGNKRPWTGCVMSNCVGYAKGRFNEIIGKNNCRYLGTGHAGTMWNNCNGLSRGQTPKLGAVACWSGGSTGCGHVAIVEKIYKDESILVSESSWSGFTSKQASCYYWRTYRIYKTYEGRKPYPLSGYKFQGFIYNPAVDSGTKSYGGSITETEASKVTKDTTPTTTTTIKYKTEKVKTLVETESLKTAEYDGELNRTKSATLLSYPSLVESPFIIVKIGDYTFGSYTKQGSTEKANSTVKVDYPNYMDSIEIVKVNGSVNTYKIQMVYALEAGDDPNFLDKVFSSVGYGTIKISYGDWSSPSYVYKEEEALITKVTSNVDFANSTITYNVSCTSTALSLMGGSYNFSARTAKPSDVIKEILFNKTYGLTDIFYGMSKKSDVLSRGLIASDDKQVKIEAKSGIDALSYINYLVTCMSSTTNTDTGPLRDSSYYLTLYDDTYGEYGGPYFKVTKVLSKTKTIASADTYEVDVGFPGENLVTDFQINDDNSWALLYNYSSSINKQNYVYSIDGNGNILTEYSPNITTSSTYNKTTEAQKSWWTQMTQFPITATMTIKGLVRPAMLMTYLRVNAFFYGQRHVSSGLYIITKQQDKIDSRGYKTILSLTRIGGDEDYIEKTTSYVDQTIITGVEVTTKTTGTSTKKTKKTTKTTQEQKNKALSDAIDLHYKVTETMYGDTTGNITAGKMTRGDFSRMGDNSSIKKWYLKKGETLKGRMAVKTATIYSRYEDAYKKFGRYANDPLNTVCKEKMDAWRKTTSWGKYWYQ
jgi:surface antigen